MNDILGRVYSVRHRLHQALPWAISPLFECNVCSQWNLVKPSSYGRETTNCTGCGSTVRMRAIVYHITKELFGCGMSLNRIPVDKSIIGYGMSDWVGYADVLQQKTGYINTFYHREPKLDITNPPESLLGTADFVVSSDVFEHVETPVQRAFDNTFALLKPGGRFIFTVPFGLDGETVEHFPKLHKWQLEERNGEWVLINLQEDGETVVHSGLCFHGGAGATLEMRIFAWRSLQDHLAEAGFSNFRIAGDESWRWGIYWPKPWSLPIIARK